MKRRAFQHCTCWSLLPVILTALFLTAGCSRKPSDRVVVVYTSADQEYAETIIAEFRKRHPGVLVLARYDDEATKSTGLVDRLRAERSDPQCDVFWANEPFLTEKLAQEGLLKEWESEAVRDWPESFRHPSRYWYGFAARARVIAYDPTRLSDPPQNWRDLADPRFRSRVVIADPNFGTTRGHVCTWFNLWGAADSTQFLRDLRANDIRVVRSNSQAVRDIVAGLADLGFTDTDDVWAAQRNGYNVQLVYPRHGAGAGQGTLLIPNTVSLVAGRPENADAGLFAEFLLSEWCQMLLHGTSSHNVPILPGALAANIEIEERYRIPDPLITDVAAVSAGMEEAMAAVNEILLGR